MHRNIILLVLLVAAVPVHGTPPMWYPIPRPVEIKFVFDPKVQETGEGNVVITVLSRIGTTNDIKLSFTGSDDFRITPATGTIASIAEGKTAEFIITLTKGRKPAGTRSNSWLMLTFSLLPDYDRMVESVEGNQKDFPSLTLRAGLCKRLEKAGKEKPRYRDSVTYNLGD